MPHPLLISSQRELRPLVRGAYDLQKLRIGMGGRLYANFRSRLGFHPNRKIEDQIAESELTGSLVDDNTAFGGTEFEEAKEVQAKMILDALKAEYNLLTEGVARNRTLPNPAVFKGGEIIHSYADLILVRNFMELYRREQEMFRHFELVLDGIPIYRAWLRDVVGVGPTMAGVLLSEIDIHKADTPSKIWALAGLDVAEDGKGRSKRAEHLVLRKYIAKDGTEKEKLSITFNPLLKTKCVGVLGPSFLRVGSGYAQVFYDIRNRYRERERQREDGWTDGHILRASIRYMVKIFLRDFWLEWRALEGLTIRPSYAEEKLGQKHSGPRVDVTARRVPPPREHKASRAEREAAEKTEKKLQRLTAKRRQKATVAATASPAEKPRRGRPKAAEPALSATHTPQRTRRAKAPALA